MSPLEEKKTRVTTEVWIHILASVEDLIERGYMDVSMKNKALEKFLDNHLEKEKGPAKASP